MIMEVSVATLDDVPQLCELLELLFSQEAEFQADRAIQSAGLRQIVEQPEQGQILVLRDGPSAAGMVNLLFTISTALGGRVGILEKWLSNLHSEVVVQVLCCCKRPSMPLNLPVVFA